MTSVFTKLVGRCFPCSGRHDRTTREPEAEAMERKEGLSTDELCFVIPDNDFQKFVERRPERGTELSVGEFMFFYKYVTSKENFRQPGADHQWVMYFFRERRSIHLMKGWVPTKKSYENYKLHEKHPLSVDNKTKLLQVNTVATQFALESQNMALIKEQGNELQGKSSFQSTSVHPGLPVRKSAYNWGVISSWSRYMAPESDDNTPFEFAQNTKSGCYSSASMNRLTKEINAAIEGKSLKEKQAGRRCNSNGMFTSTIDTRERRIRPRAAKGPRKPPIMRDEYKL